LNDPWRVDRDERRGGRVDRWHGSDAGLVHHKLRYQLGACEEGLFDLSQAGVELPPRPNDAIVQQARSDEYTNNLIIVFQ
jgi:hypothetical protein